MPDHLHGLLLFDKQELSGPPPVFESKFGPQHDNLAAVLRGFKAGVSSFAKAQGVVFTWQSRYHDRVVRSADELTRIREYITTNPQPLAARARQRRGPLPLVLFDYGFATRIA